LGGLNSLQNSVIMGCYLMETGGEMFKKLAIGGPLTIGTPRVYAQRKPLSTSQSIFEIFRKFENFQRKAR